MAISDTEKTVGKKPSAQKPTTIREILRAGRPEKVSIHLPIDRRKPDTLYVSVNGVRYSIKRGQTVTVPWIVAQVIEQSEKSDIEVQERMARLSANPFVSNL